MSGPTRKSSTALVTIWVVVGRDERNRKTYSAPYTVKCCVDTGGSRKLVDSKGVEFVPQLTAWYELSGSAVGIGEGDYIAKGDQTSFAKPVDAGAYPIRVVKLQDCSSMGQKDDVLLGA